MKTKIILFSLSTNSILKQFISKRKLPIASVLSLMLLVNACNGDEPTLNERNRGASVKDEIADRFAKVLATSLEDENVRSFVKKSASKRFDGDVNFLFQAVKNDVLDDKSVSGARSKATFADILFGNTTSSTGREQSSTFLDSLERLHPLLQIAMPTLPTASIDDWDASNEIPWVVVLTGNVGEELTAYDQDGNIHKISSTVPPDRPVIVVGENERVIAVAKTAENEKSFLNGAGRAQSVAPLFENSNYAYYNSSDYYEALNNAVLYEGGGSGGGGSSGTSSCTRDARSNKDELVRMSFAEIRYFNQASQWFDSGLEIEFTITFANANGAISKLTKFVSGPDRDFRNCPFPGLKCKPAWKEINAEIVTWDKSIYGNAMHYFWVEKDPGTTTTYTTSFSTTFNNTNGTTSTINNTISIPITDEDDLLGEAIVEYCDNANGDGYEYSTGKVKFNVKER